MKMFCCGDLSSPWEGCGGHLRKNIFIRQGRIEEQFARDGF